MMMMLSMLIQVWATLSEEERESRRAQMRDHSAQVIDNSNQFYVGIHLTWVVFWHIFLYQTLSQLHFLAFWAKLSIQKVHISIFL